MRINETFKSAVTSLLLNKGRTLLTMLGVIIGVFAVVALVSVVQGFKNYITKQFSEIGSNLLLVMPGGNFNPAAAFLGNKLDLKQVDDIKLYAGEKIDGATPSIRLDKTSTYKTNSYSAFVVGGNYESDQIYDLKLEEGRFYSKSDELAKARVAVIGSEVKKQLFGSKDPVNERFKIGNESFTVIGVVESKGQRFDDRVFVPSETLKSSFGISQIASITVKVKDGVDIQDAKRTVKLALLRNLKKDDFTIMSQDDILSTINSILNVLSVGLAAIAGISLLVGGIGIMNIMLVSVTERTSEIGLRKALGATPRNITLQFMYESIMISAIGGLIGLGIAVLAVLGLRSFLDATIPWWSILVSMGFSLVVGVVFGTYPAVNAGKMDPIEALRFE